MCLSLGHETRGFSLPALHGQSVRRAHRLRYLWPHDRKLTAPGTELPPPLPRQTLRDRVSIVLTRTM